MNLQQLEYIIALDKIKNFSKAAESCFITQATLSTMIRRLEDELDVVLFDRKSNPVQTTDCGVEIIEEAKKIVYHSRNLKQIASIVKNKIEGEIKIGIIPTIAGNLLNRILPELITKYPALKLNIVEITTNSILRQLKTGEIDVGIVSTPLEKQDVEEEILYYEKLMVYGKIDSNKKYLVPREISEHKIWLLEEGHCLRDQFINLCSLNTKEIEKNLSFQPNSFDSLINLVDSLGGLTLIPELYFTDLAEEKKTKVIQFTSPFPVREVSLIFYRPFAKHRIISMLTKEIKALITPMLESTKIKNTEKIIARM
jgi:LysR family transcriptional regulator, hydrogen peroxide-inducible genes activator